MRAFIVEIMREQRLFEVYAVLGLFAVGIQGFLDVQSKKCAVCDGTNFLYRCGTTDCRGGACYLQIHEGSNGGQLFYAGCALMMSLQNCAAKVLTRRNDYKESNDDHHYAYNVPLTNRPNKLLCGECCIYGDECNRRLCGLRGGILDIYRPTNTPSIARQSTTTPIPTTTVMPLICETCSGPLCGVVPGTSIRCTQDKPYCMNSVHNADGGAKTIVKQCASAQDCDVKWFKGSYGDGVCAQFSTNTIYPFDFTCNYCCVTDNCNGDVRPPDHLMYGLYKAKITTSATKAVTATATPATTPAQTTVSTTISSTAAATTRTTAALQKPIKCEVCSGPLCGVIETPATLCPADKPYCINSIYNHADGTKEITKQCSAYGECSTKWLHGSFTDSACGTLDLKNNYPFPFECHYCCTKDSCNTDNIPKEDTLLKGPFALG